MPELNLGKQVGPLPLGAWIAILVGGLGIGYFINRSQSSKAPEPQLLAEAGVGQGGGGLTYDPPQTVTPTTPERTNLTWGQEAVNWLISTNVDAYSADLAVRKYLTGDPLTVAEKAMINLVLARQGAPPEPLPTTEPTPTPTTPPATTTRFMQFTTSPRNPVGTRPFRLTGIILKDGKPTAGTIRVDYSRPSFSGWRPNGFAPFIFANPWGNWVFLHPGLGADATLRFTWVEGGADVKSIQWTARVR